jgi:hypothetical protein
MNHEQGDAATSSSSFIPHPSFLRSVPSLICSLVVAAVAGGFAFYHISAPMPWADELQTLGCSMVAWREGLYLATHSQNMPVGYWLISKTVISLAGVSFVPMRVVSGVAFVAFAWLASRLLLRWLPMSIAIPAALLIVTHPALVWHARDGRVYAILLLAETAGVALMLARPFRGRAILWTLTSAAMVYLHHHALFVLAIQAVIMFDLRMDLRRCLPLVALLVLPDLVFIYWGMQSPNVASQMFGAGQTFGPNVLLNLDRVGAGSPEYVYGPLPPVWRKALGGAMILVPTVITAMRGGTPLSWMGLASLWFLIVPAAVHDAMDVFYEPRFVVLIIPLVIVWILSSLAKLPTRLPAWLVSAGLVGLFVATDLDVIRPHILPYRPCRADINDALERMPGKIVMHPGYLVGCWPVPPGFDRQGRVVLSDEGVMVGVERRVASGNATLYSPDMPWSRFRREIVHNGPFTLIQGSPMLYPRKHEDFCRPDEPWQTGYRMERLWPDHPFVVIYRFEPL